MDQDKTTVMGGYGSAQAGDSADATRVVPNPGYTDPAATQPSAEPTRVMDYGDTAQDSYAASSHGPYGNAAPDPFDYAPQDSYAASTPNPYDDLPQNPIPQPQQTTYMPRTAQPRYESREPYREYPKSIPQYGEDEEKKPSRSSSVIKKILIVLAIFFALSIVFAIVSGMLNKRGATTSTTAEQTEVAQVGAVELGDIPGQYWSNAKKILKSRGADLSNAVVLTDDGSTPVVDANWVVTSAYYNDNGNLEIQLTHKNSSGNSSDGQSGTDSSSSNMLEDLSNKAQELGDKAQELGDTTQNLGDTAQNLGDMATDAWNALQNGILGAQGN
ncbi:hypothetical protein DXB98_02320 [Collinsella sp. OM07-12]|jgi:hypothetical protein|uniref:hypothetical protein n=1 Tax=Collinsella sp. OM07-12 TaxID=2292328 RepID=UPI000E43D05E|nr:hypothetical protein [Collinsella sp. OM07-12]RGM75966.1 hypothetical protein DXB98_02320 [Collinsella sp. OM07-12]